VHKNVLDGCGLTQYVRSLQVPEGQLSLTASLGLVCCDQLGLDAGVDAASESGHGLVLRQLRRVDEADSSGVFPPGLERSG
jgi:hypothetical protein